MNGISALRITFHLVHNTSLKSFRSCVMKMLTLARACHPTAYHVYSMVVPNNARYVATLWTVECLIIPCYIRPRLSGNIVDRGMPHYSLSYQATTHCTWQPNLKLMAYYVKHQAQICCTIIPPDITLERFCHFGYKANLRQWTRTPMTAYNFLQKVIKYYGTHLEIP